MTAKIKSFRQSDNKTISDFLIEVHSAQMNEHKFQNVTRATVFLIYTRIESIDQSSSKTSQTYHSSVEDSGSRDWRTDSTAAYSDEPDDLLPFPTLETLLKTLDEDVGVNVEIKYPQFIDVRRFIFKMGKTRGIVQCDPDLTPTDITVLEVSKFFRLFFHYFLSFNITAPHFNSRK